MLIGELVKTHIDKIFQYCESKDRDELFRLMDNVYSKKTFNINFPFCKEYNQIMKDDEYVRFWKKDYTVRNKDLRVSSQWVITSKELFLDYLKKKEIITIDQYAHYQKIVQADPNKRSNKVQVKLFMAEQNAIRLNTVLRELNISLDRAMEFLAKKGYDIKARPTTKISQEVHDILANEFARDKSKKETETKLSLPNFIGATYDAELMTEAREMSTYYELFYALERSVRKLIADAMENKYGKDWWQARVDFTVKESVRKNLEYELDTPHTKRSDAPIDYTTFGDLCKIINSNWGVFESRFKKNLSTVNEILIDLNRLRVPIAHCNPMPPKEVNRLALRLDDWTELLNK